MEGALQSPVSDVYVAYRDGVSVSSEGVQVRACLHIPDMNDPIVAAADLVRSMEIKTLKLAVKRHTRTNPITTPRNIPFTSKHSNVSKALLLVNC